MQCYPGKESIREYSRFLEVPYVPYNEILKVFKGKIRVDI